MIVYEGLIRDFHKDVINGVIADRVEEGFRAHGFEHNNPGEHRAFENSLPQLDSIFDQSFGINQDLTIAIEFQIPSTAKRIDFIICGKDENDRKNAVIIELKQWEDIELSKKKDIVITYVARAYREETHPSYQAYSYARTIENFNEAVQRQHIKMVPCAFLHNFKESNRGKIEDARYSEIIKEAPVFLQRDRQKLADFIKKYVVKPDGGKILYEIENGKIRLPFNAVDGIGENAAKQIYEAAHDGSGDFISCDDLMVRAHIGQSTVDLLRATGAIGDLPSSNQISLFGF